MTTEGSGAMFDAIAPRYDLLNRIISLGIDRSWREQTARAVGSALRVLDVATGTGDLAIAIAGRSPLVRVIGVDPSEKMIAIAKDKCAPFGDRIELVLGDAEELPFPDASFDATSIAFGIRNVPDRERGLREMARVTRRGGRIAVLELTEPRRGALAPFARFHVHHVVPTIGAWLSGAREYRYLARSIAAFPAPEEFARTMERAGWTNVSITPLTLGTCTLFAGERA